MKMNFDDIDPAAIMQVIKTGSLAALDKDQQEYYSMMELVRGLQAKWVHNNKVITKATIIKMLKSSPYDLSDYQARMVYGDSLNFFYAQENIKREAFSNMYADKLDKAASLALLSGREEVAGKLIVQAATLRGCYEKKDHSIPEELLNQKPMVIYTADITDTGVQPADRKQLEEFLDSIPDIPVITRESVKQDARIRKFDIIERMKNDTEEFNEEDTEDQ